jgi:hypothetical protein
MMLKAAWTSVMDPNKNGLKALPRIVRFQLMVVLASLWSAIFCASAGLMYWLPGYLLVHLVLLLIGIFGTGWLFGLAADANNPGTPGSK